MYATMSLKLGNKIKYKSRDTYYKTIGMGYYTKGDYIKVIENWQQSLATFDSMGDKIGISNILMNIGSVYTNQGDDAQAIEIYLQVT